MKTEERCLIDESQEKRPLSKLREVVARLLSRPGILTTGVLLLATLLFAATAAKAFVAHGPSQLSVIGTSATQAILNYQAPDANPCQVQVSTNASMTPLAADVNPTLFTAANQDNRPGSASNSPTDRYFVAGKRRSDVALDGLRHSRALQAFTLYYVSVNCDGTAATTQFTTANPPLGNNYPEPPPFDATA